MLFCDFFIGYSNKFFDVKNETPKTIRYMTLYTFVFFYTLMYFLQHQTGIFVMRKKYVEH